MPSWRERESGKQARCREQNEVRARAPAGESDGFFRCECGDGNCMRSIALTPAEYSRVRLYATHFAVACNHENPESEHVVEENERFAVVETVTGDATRLARRSDPGQRRRELRWRVSSAPLLNMGWHRPPWRSLVASPRERR